MIKVAICDDEKQVINLLTLTGNHARMMAETINEVTGE